MSDLVKRLRDTPNWARESFEHWKTATLTYDRAPFEAADRIEALEAEVERLTALNARFAQRDLTQIDRMFALEQEVERLTQQRDDFHMQYRMKCDEETKSQADEIERLRTVVRRRTLLLERVLQCGLNEEPHGVGFTPSKQERLAGDLARDIMMEMRGIDALVKP